ncbi:MAG: hypothetical protein OHK0046_14470 [Anaerolineae bacterium]
MTTLTDIFSEYINMRTHNMGVSEALQALSQYIDTLSRAEKQDLGNYIRTWEKKNGALVEKAKEKTTQEIKAADIRQTSTVKSLKDLAKETTWITCANCDRKNRIEAVFCHACGHMLEQTQGKFLTRQFSDAAVESAHYYGRDSLLVMRVRDTEHEYELRPQLTDHELVIGRNAENSAITPDIDLNPAGADKLGVSRLHIAIKFDPDAEAIQIYDLGSANGSFINGQKILPKEVRILRNGDEVRMGRLVARMNYYHPGKEVKVLR